MRRASIVSVLLVIPVIASICMWVLLVLERRLLFEDSLVTIFVYLWLSGLLCSVIGLIYSAVIARRYSAFDIGALGIVSGIGIVANVLGVLYVLTSTPRL